MFFNSFQDLFKILIVGPLSYLILIFILRVSGKRTLSKMNSFDFIITIALGSTISSVLISKQISLAEGTLAFIILTLLQFSITWLSVNLRFVKKVVTAKPTVVFYRGKYCESIMKSERITKSEILAALREHGIGSTSQVDCIVLETTGNLSVIKNLPDNNSSTIIDLQQFDTQ